MIDDQTTKDAVCDWCEGNRLYDLPRRLLFVSEEDIEKHILFESPSQAEAWLDKNGY